MPSLVQVALQPRTQISYGSESLCCILPLSLLFLLSLSSSTFSLSTPFVISCFRIFIPFHFRSTSLFFFSPFCSPSYLYIFIFFSLLFTLFVFLLPSLFYSYLPFFTSTALHCTCLSFFFHPHFIHRSSPLFLTPSLLHTLPTSIVNLILFTFFSLLSSLLLLAYPVYPVFSPPLPLFPFSLLHSLFYSPSTSSLHPLSSPSYPIIASSPPFSLSLLTLSSPPHPLYHFSLATSSLLPIYPSATLLLLSSLPLFSSPSPPTRLSPHPSSPPTSSPTSHLLSTHRVLHFGREYTESQLSGINPISGGKSHVSC